MIPDNIQKTLNLFSDLNYVLFKCEHILEGSNKNVDLLFSDDEYQKASSILESNSFVLYMPESVEKYKKMYVKFDLEETENNLTAIHLHREVAWHGIIALDKKPILERAKNNLPSPEDSLLIHSAHALFENFKIREFEKKLLEGYKQKAADHEYIDSQLQKNGWKGEFYQFVKEFSISKAMIVRAYAKNFLKERKGAFHFSYKAAKAFIRTFSLKRRGFLIALVGMNGTGKTTLKENLLKAYSPLSSFIAGQQGYYFGWKRSTLSNVLSKIVKVKNEKENDKEKFFDAMTEEKIKNFDLFKEALFFYIYVEYLFRYVRNIYPCLRSNKLVICDRYFYDICGQYPYSKNSRILPLLRFPKPDALFVLDADVETVMKRGKTGKKERNVQPKEKLEGQKMRYQNVALQNEGDILDAQQRSQDNIIQVINLTWRDFVKL